MSCSLQQVPSGPAGWNRARQAVLRVAALTIFAALNLAACACTRSSGGTFGARSAAPLPTPDADIVVDGSATYQSWDGWGLSISGRPWEWTVPHYGNRIPPEEQRRLQDALFGPDGYNLAIVYPPLWVNPATSQLEGYEPHNDGGNPDRYTWSSFRFLYTPGDPDPFAKPGQRNYTAATYRVIAALQRYGTTLIYNADAFPDWMVPSKHELRRDLEPEFVEYVTAFPVFVRQQLGYSFPYLIVANEPDLNLDTSPEQQARLLAMTRDRLRQQGLSSQLIAPKTSTLSAAQQYMNAVLRRAGLAADIPVLATHTYPTRTYDAPETRSIRQLASVNGRRLWMTEYSDAPDLQLDRDESVDTLDRALAWADRVQRDLTEMEVNAWFAIFPVLEPGHYPADALIVMRPDYADPTRNTWQFTRRYYALAQYTRFIRPGAVRLEARASTPDLAVVAFRDPVTEAVALVAVNRADGDMQVQVRFDNLAVGSTVAYRTSENERLDCLGPATLTEAGVSLQLPGRSITTLATGPPSAALACSG